jgi:hypothetical protein
MNKEKTDQNKQMIPDFSSWLYTTDADFIEDRNLFKEGWFFVGLTDILIFSIIIYYEY